jgi:hypothetical protein
LCPQIASTVNDWSVAVPLNMYPVNLAGPGGQALVRKAVTWSADDSVPPPRRTFGDGHVAEACDWVFGGLSTVLTTSW